MKLAKITAQHVKREQTHADIPLLTIHRKLKAGGLVRLNEKALEVLGAKDGSKIHMETMLVEDTTSRVVAMRVTADDTYNIINPKTGMENKLSSVAIKNSSLQSSRFHTMICDTLGLNPHLVADEPTSHYAKLVGCEDGWFVLEVFSTSNQAKLFTEQDAEQDATSTDVSVSNEQAVPTVEQTEAN